MMYIIFQWCMPEEIAREATDDEVVALFVEYVASFYSNLGG